MTPELELQQHIADLTATRTEIREIIESAGHDEITIELLDAIDEIISVIIISLSVSDFKTFIETFSQLHDSLISFGSVHVAEYTQTILSLQATSLNIDELDITQRFHLDAIDAILGQLIDEFYEEAEENDDEGEGNEIGFTPLDLADKSSTSPSESSVGE